MGIKDLSRHMLLNVKVLMNDFTGNKGRGIIFRENDFKIGHVSSYSK